ncbi:flagellar biosynthesis anti-sigma factor FlgM [Dechloromonas sp. TW-R-39-2]|nr:flagellar biosynthesis anti-sigma factor FlgM [Dechloromonas sp. TW-R-39-2]
MAVKPYEFQSIARTTMKIDNSYKTTSTPPPTRQQPKSPAETPSSTEAVSLSTLAGTLQASEKPPVNLAKIQEIKDAIAQGRFKINPEAIAGRLLDSARDLVNSQRNA